MGKNKRLCLYKIDRRCEQCRKPFTAERDKIAKGFGRFCSRLCGSTNRSERSPLSRFWAKVDKSPGQGPQGDCWQWTGYKRAKGYGGLDMHGKAVLSHVFSYTHHFGAPPSEKPFVLHVCDNPPCVRPDHLFVGTRGDNNADRASKGRSAFGDRNGSRTRPEKLKRGTDNGNSKLTPEIVSQMRHMYGSGGKISHAALAAIFHCSPATAAQIIRRTTWKHIA